MLIGDCTTILCMLRVCHQAPTERVRVFLSSSTLGGVCFLRGWECLGEHADFETVAGGTLSILKRSWEQSYHSLNIATDTLLVRKKQKPCLNVFNLLSF